MKDNFLFAFLSFFFSSFLLRQSFSVWTVLCVSQTEDKAELELKGMHLPVPSHTGLGLTVCNKQLTHPLGFTPLSGSIQKKNCPYSIVTIGRNGSFLMLLPRGHAHSCSLQSPLYFSNLSLFRLGKDPCACNWLPGSHYTDKCGLIITKTHMPLVLKSWD